MNEEMLFQLALEKPPADRAAFLEQACAGDNALRQRVELLLRAHDNPGSFLAQPPVPSDSTGPVPGAVAEGPRSHIGPYKLLQQIGEGGMGTVFMAEQTHPVQRKVALKVIKPGLDSAHILARFEAERQALALMDHPNIAKVLDGGTTVSGRPYFVMELVKGVAITRYCDTHHLKPRQRLELFMPVCQAVQHAHTKGIIHRDLKPSNVVVALYDSQPVPKVIDFGAAKATGPKLTERTLFTEFGAIVGTLEYMSPEQAELNNQDIDTRSDVYSLGVLLYELLTGTTPLDRKRLKESALLDLLRAIREEDPPRPSTRLSTTEELAAIAANRGLEPKKLSGLVRGELDWIVMKCLEKDRTRRYETANSLARDIERYLHDETVQACPPSVSYRLRKFVRRNKRGLMTVALLGVMLLLALGAVAGSIGWALSDRANRASVLADQVTQAISEARQLHADGLLDEAKAVAKRAEGLLLAQEEDGELHEQVRQLKKDLALVEDLHEIRLEQYAMLATAYDILGADVRYAQAFRDYDIDIAKLSQREAVERISASAIRLELAVALDNWAWVRWIAGKKANLDWKELLTIARLADPDPLRQQLRQAFENKDVETFVKVAATEKTYTLPTTSATVLSKMLFWSGRLEQAEKFLQKVRQQHPKDFWINNDLGTICSLSALPRQADEAIRFFDVAVTLRPQSAGAHINLANALANKERWGDAITECRAALRLAPHFALGHAILGRCLSGRGTPDEAFSAAKKAIDLQPNYPYAHFQLGIILSKQKKLREAADCYQKAIELRANYAEAHYNLGVVR
jgi:serine/threonine protein kinase/Flp pilus assembly protein TadD